MSATYKCDGCGKEAPAIRYGEHNLDWLKPHDWFQRSDKDGIQDACSRECIQKIAEKTGKTGVVRPI